MFIYADEAEKYKLDDVCVHENTTYKSGNEWKLDSCRKCKCVSGHIECTEMVCPQVCMDTIHQPGKCCPVCAGMLKSINEKFLKKYLIIDAEYMSKSTQFSLLLILKYGIPLIRNNTW